MKKQFLSLFIIFCLIPLSLPSGMAQEAKSFSEVLDTRVSFDVQNAEIDGVLKAMAESFDLNIVVPETIVGKVTLTLKEVRLEDALDLILESTGYFYRVRDNVVLIVAPEKDLMTEVVSLNYAKASEIQGSLEAFKSENGSIAAVEKENRLIIKDTPKKVKIILEEIKKMDKYPTQILIEARMVEVEDTDLSAFGVTWSGNLNLTGLSEGGGGKGPLGSRTFDPPGTTTDATTTLDSGNFALSLPETSSDLSGGQLTYGFTFNRAHVATTIDALVRSNKAHLLASPSIATMSGQEARIIIGEKFPFRENTLTAVGTTETTKFIDVGTALRVTPTVIGEDQIMMDIHPEVSSVSATLDAGPRIDTREATTKIVVKNGQTIVIAGLIKHEKTVIRQEVPFFANLPLLGAAFRNKSTDFVARELAVFITPYLMRPMTGEEGETTIDVITPVMLYNSGVRLLDDMGIESLGKREEQRYSEAIAHFKNVARNFQESEFADDALYQLGLLYFERLKNYKQAAQTWNQLKISFPDSPYVTRDLLSKLKSAERKAEQKARKNTKKFR